MADDRIVDITTNLISLVELLTVWTIMPHGLIVGTYIVTGAVFSVLKVSVTLRTPIC